MRMKVSQINKEAIRGYIREYELDACEDDTLQTMQKAAVEYVKSYTGLTESELDEHEDITVAVLAIISDMWDNRQMYVDRSNTNRIVESILGMYAVNLLPEV